MVIVTGSFHAYENVVKTRGNRHHGRRRNGGCYRRVAANYASNRQPDSAIVAGQYIGNLFFSPLQTFNYKISFQDQQ